MKEKEIENSILDWLLFVPNSLFWKCNSIGVWDNIRKTYRLNRNRHHINGVSDILGVCNSRFIAIEVKTKRGRLTENQSNYIDNINKYGGLAFTARSIDEVRERLTKEGLYERGAKTRH